MDINATAEGLQSNPNDVILNLSGQDLTEEQIDILKLGLRHGLATRPDTLEMMAISEDTLDQVRRLNSWKEGFFTKDKVKNSLNSLILAIQI